MNREIVLAHGSLTRAKGIEFMCNLYRSNEKLRAEYLFVLIGKVGDLDYKLVNSFAESGGLFIEQYLQDSEFINLYNIADYIWGCYDPSFNHSSGMFGRAYQLNKKTIVRKNSYLHTYQKKLSSGYASEYDNLSLSAEIMLNPPNRGKLYTAEEHNKYVIENAKRFRKFIQEYF